MDKYVILKEYFGHYDFHEWQAEETAMAKSAGYASQKQRMAEMTKFLKEQKGIPQEYDEYRGEIGIIIINN